MSKAFFDILRSAANPVSGYGYAKTLPGYADFATRPAVAWQTGTNSFDRAKALATI
jgi:hypothetical protein